MRRTLNLRFLTLLMVGIVVFGAGVHFLHGYQVKRNAKAFLEQAHEAKDRNDLTAAANYLSKYLVYIPGNVEALAEYGLLLDKMAAPAGSKPQDWELSRRAYYSFEKSLRLDPHPDNDRNRDVRRKLVNMAMELERYSDAQAHIEILYNDPKLINMAEKAELERMLGQCCEASRAFKKAEEYFRMSINDAPDQPESYKSLANLYRSALNKPAEADEVMEDLIKKNKKSFRAYLARARYRKECKFPGKAADDVRIALTLGAKEPPADYVDVILFAAELAREGGKKEDLAEARKALKIGLHLYPKSTPMHLRLAEIELADQKPAVAKACLKRGLKVLPDQSQLLWNLASLLVEEGKDDQDQELSDAIARMKNGGVSPDQLDYFTGRIRINQERWPQAIQVLERIRLELEKRPELVKQIDLWLGRCYSQMQDFDQAYIAFRRALAVDSLWVPACLGMGSTLTAMGKIDDALEFYRRITPQNLPARLEAARLLIMKNLGLDPNDRRWGEFEKYLAEAEADKAFLLQVVLLRADFLATQGKEGLEQARQLISKARQGEPKRPELSIALADLVSRQGKPNEALSILKEVEKQLGDRERFSPQARWQLLMALMNSYARLGDRWEAQRLGDQLAKERPKDLNVRLALFGIAVEHGLEPEIVRLLAEIRKIEGPEGSLWRFGKVQYLIWQAQMEGAHKELQAANDRLLEATELLKTIAVRRPTWSGVPLGQALIEDVTQKLIDKSRRNFAQANQFYLQAFKGGERNPEVIRRAFECLIKQQQWKEAQEVLNKIPEQAFLTSDLQRLAEVSFKQNDGKRALELANKAVQNQPENPLGHLWLGELWWGLKKEQNAEAEFQLAEAKADKRPDVWVAVVFHWVHARKKVEAEAALEKARAEIPPEHAPLALGQCYEMMASLDKAKEQYWMDKAKEQFEAALMAKPEDVATLRSVATFRLQTGKSEEAKVPLRKLIDLKAQSPGDADWARNILAIVLASQGDYQQSQSALKLTTDESPEGLRAHALILMAQKGHRKQYASTAIAKLEKIESPTPDDRFLLAKLYENVDQWPKARDQMILLLDSSGDSSALLTYFVYFVKSSVAHQEPDVAAWLERLKKQLPEAAGTAELAEIESRYFAAQKEPEKAVDAALGYLKNAKPTECITRLRWAAGVLDNLSEASPAERKFPSKAEELYRELVASKSDQILLLVSFVGRQGRIREALDLCERERAWQICSAEEVGNVCMNVLHAGSAGKEHLERVERWLESAIAKQPKTSTALTVCMADLQDLQGRYREAEESYRQALEKDPRNVVALNNLAWLLALREGQGEEALNLLNRAMEIAGPLPALLDTQGVAYMAIGKADQAIKVLEQAMEDEPAAAFSFHLAEARKMQHNSMGAKEAFAKATESLGLKPERLHPLERNAYEQLLAEYKLAGN